MNTNTCRTHTHVTQTDRQTDRQTDTHAHRHTEMHTIYKNSPPTCVRAYHQPASLKGDTEKAQAYGAKGVAGTNCKAAVGWVT
jgi:hypothetical protein